MDEVIQQNPLEKRLACAQMLSGLLKQKQLLKWKPKGLNGEVASEIEEYVKAQLNNLLLKVMGEQTNELFSSEEIAILRAFVTRLRATTNGATKQ